jgi:cytochrome c5
MKWIGRCLMAAAAMGTASLAMAADGKAVYEGTCVVCHGTGAVGSPKFGDKAAWAPRIAQGKTALLASALNGKNAMPPTGGNSNLTPDEVSAAIDYMISAAK